MKFWKPKFLRPLPPTDPNTFFSSYRMVQFPESVRIIAYLFGFFFIIILLMLFFVPWQQTSFGMGRVVAYAPTDRQQYIESPIKGRVTKWHVREGSRIKKGDPIVEISDNDPKYLSRLLAIKKATEERLAAAELQRKSYRSKLSSVSSSLTNTVNAGSAKVRMSRQKITASKNKFDASKAELVTTEKNLSRSKKLFQKGLISKRKLELAELYYTKARTENDRAKANLRIAESDYDNSIASMGKNQFDARAKLDGTRAEVGYTMLSMAKIREELEKINTKIARQELQKVYSPRDGTIMRILAIQDSAQLKEGDPLVILIPDSKSRAVELFVEGNDIPLITENRHVRIQFQGWPALQLSGYPQLAVGTFGGFVRLVDVTDNGTGKFRVLVVPDNERPWPSTKYLRQGVRAKGWILLNQVSTGFEIWRRFNDFPPMIPMNEPPIQKKLHYYPNKTPKKDKKSKDK
ncbi:MAG: HlyD family efflux transporter periplasmic adaptor subunit [Spirochaetota bacterium]